MEFPLMDYRLARALTTSEDFGVGEAGSVSWMYTKLACMAQLGVVTAFATNVIHNVPFILTSAAYLSGVITLNSSFGVCIVIGTAAYSLFRGVMAAAKMQLLVVSYVNNALNPMENAMISRGAACQWRIVRVVETVLILLKPLIGNAQNSVSQVLKDVYWTEKLRVIDGSQPWVGLADNVFRRVD